MMRKLFLILTILLLAVVSYAGPYEESRKAGIDAFNKGKYEYALKCFQSVLKIAPANNDLAEWIGKCKKKISESSNTTNHPSLKQSDSYYLDQAKKCLKENRIEDAEKWIGKIRKPQSESYLVKGDLKYLYKFGDWGWRDSYLTAAFMGNEEAKEKSHGFIIDNTILTSTINPQNDAERLAKKADSLHAARDFKKSFDLYLESAKNGYATAQLNVARFYLHGYGTARDFHEAFIWATKAANSDDVAQVSAKGILSWFYFNGIGVERDYKKAYDLVKNQHYGILGINNGLCNEFGFGTDINKVKALDIYRYIIQHVEQQSSYRVYSQAISIVGAEYSPYDVALERYCHMTCVDNMNDTTKLDGDFYLKLAVGTKALSGEAYVGSQEREIYKNYSIEYYDMAFRLGLTRSSAIFALASHYRTEKEYKKAFELYSKIADNDKYACMWLGIFYENGYGVQRDNSKAKEWYLRAKGLGNNSVDSDIKRLEKKGY